MSENKITQNQKILQHLRKYSGITTLVAFRMYGITRLASRISELRKEGYDITADRIYVGEGSDRKMVCQYRLKRTA